MGNYSYKDNTPLQYGEDFIDNYLTHHTVEDFEPQGISNYIKGVFMLGVDKIFRQNKNEQYDKFIKELNDILAVMLEI